MRARQAYLAAKDSPEEDTSPITGCSTKWTKDFCFESDSSSNAKNLASYKCRVLYSDGTRTSSGGKGRSGRSKEFTEEEEKEEEEEHLLPHPLLMPRDLILERWVRL